MGPCRTSYVLEFHGSPLETFDPMAWFERQVVHDESVGAVVLVFVILDCHLE